MNPAAPLVVLLSLLCGQQLTLPPEVKGDPGTFIIVRAETDCPSLRWLPLDDGLSLIPPELLRDSRCAIVMAGKPGKYRLLCYGAKGDTPTSPAVTRVAVGHDAPPPPPPGPQAKLHVTVVTDADHVDAALAELLRSQTLRKSLDQAGHTLRLYDTTSAVLDQQHLRPLLNSVGLPALIVQQPTGQVIRGLRVPATESSFLDACRP
jgi:hypothetical protein